MNWDGRLVREYGTQRFLRRAFFEEFKIHSFNYMLMLFESVIRVATTLEARAPAKSRNELSGAEHYYSKNYKRFLESKRKNPELFQVHCMGWAHI